MKIILTNLLKKTAYGPSVDDQPNFVDRNTKQEGDVMFLKDPCPESESDIKKKWIKKRKSNRTNVVEEMPKGSL